MELLEKCIESFSEDMQDIGYAEGEVNAFVHDAIEGRKLSSLSKEESVEIMDYLNNYLSFARKCKKQHWN